MCYFFYELRYNYGMFTTLKSKCSCTMQSNGRIYLPDYFYATVHVSTVLCSDTVELSLTDNPQVTCSDLCGIFSICEL